MELPPLQLDGIKTLTDETGMFQHTKFSTIDRKEGYTTDDNARALIAVLRHYQNYKNSDALRLASIYLTFLLHMQKEDGRFHNLLGFDRRFKDKVGSEDCIGRALWATGYALSTDVSEPFKNVVKEIFDLGLPSSHSFTSPRGIALTILGLSCYHGAFPEDPNVNERIMNLSKRLIHLYRSVADDNWRWFETYLTYANPRLPQALFAAHGTTTDKTYLQVACNSLDFLIKIQVIEGMFIPIGAEDWFKRNSRRALFDQQPLEASCMIEAALKAFESTNIELYKRTAQIAFEWYHGRNIHGVSIYNENEGTSYDGITPFGLNRNQGAEATLSYYLAYLKLKESGMIIS